MGSPVLGLGKQNHQAGPDQTLLSAGRQTERSRFAFIIRNTLSKSLSFLWHSDSHQDKEGGGDDEFE